MGAWIEMAGARARAVFFNLPLSWRGVGALVVGILLARWTWALFEPHTFAVLPAKSESAEASAALFGTAAPVATTDSTESGKVSALRLVGVFSGKHGFAILRMDEKRQIGVALGEEAYKGAKLVEVAADYVLLEHNGTRQRINLENKFAGNADNKGQAETRPPALVAPSIDGAAGDPEKLAQEMQKMLDMTKSMAKDKQ